MRRIPIVALLVAVLGLIAAACGDSGTTQTTDGTAPSRATGTSTSTSGAPLDTGVTLALYNAQHEGLVKAMVEGFTNDTGIKVALRNGKDFELANQIVAEGSSSPADVFITENSPGTQIVSAKGLFAPVDATTRAQVPARWSPPTGDWVGVAARSTVLVYNPKLLAPGARPTSIMDLSNPDWKGKFGVAAAGADFQAIVSAVVAVNGVDAATAWLRGVKANAKIYSGNGAVMKAVNSGEIAAGVIYHYYWFKDRAEAGANSANTELLFFANHDAGAFVSVSGLGVLKSSKHPREAQALVAYLTGPKGQQILADSDALEYPLGSGVAANAKLKPFSELQPPDVDISKLNGPQVVELMQKAGLL